MEQEYTVDYLVERVWKNTKMKSYYGEPRVITYVPRPAGVDWLWCLYDFLRRDRGLLNAIVEAKRSRNPKRREEVKGLLRKRLIGYIKLCKQ